MKSETRALLMGYKIWSEFDPTEDHAMAKLKAVQLKKEGYFAISVFRKLIDGKKVFVVMFRVPKKKERLNHVAKL